MTDQGKAPERIWAMAPHIGEYLAEPPVSPVDHLYLTEYVRADLATPQPAAVTVDREAIAQIITRDTGLPYLDACNVVCCILSAINLQPDIFGGHAPDEEQQMQMAVDQDRQPAPPAVTVKPLGYRLREARANKGLSLRDLAKDTGVSFSVIARIERGECVTPTPKISYRLEKWLASLAFTLAPGQPATEGPDAVREAARVLLRPNTYSRYAKAFSAMDARWEDGPEAAFAAALRALEGGE